MAGSSMREVVLVASGDLRETANRARLAGPGGARAARRRGVRAPRGARQAGASRGRGAGPRLHLQPAHGHGRVRGHRSRRAARRRGGGLAVQPPRAARASAVTGGPILTVANWRGAVAGPRGHAQHQRLAHEDGPPLQLHLERGPAPTRSPTRRSRPGSSRAPSSTTRPMSATSTVVACRRPAAATGRRLAGELADRMAILGVFDEGCMGMYNAIIDDELPQPDGPLQGAPAASPPSSRRCGS